MQFLNGSEASTLVAQLTNERVYANVDTLVPRLTQTNIWNQAVKLDHTEDPVSHLTTAVACRQLSSAILSSQSLLAAIPYLYKLASDASSVVLHVAADHKGSSASFADFTHVMSVRQSGLALLGAMSVQESYDLALIAQVVSLKASTPFLHFFDSKRISNEYTSIQVLSKDDLLALLPEQLVRESFKNKTVPELAKQSAYLKYKAEQVQQQDKDQEEASLAVDAVAVVFHQVADQFAQLTGRHYAALEYVGHPEAEHVIIAMGAGAKVVEATLRAMTASDPLLKVGALKVRLYRPWSDQSLLDALPATVQRIAVLEPTDDYTSTYNPLFLDVVAAYQTANNGLVDIISGQYGVQDADFSPGQVQSVIKALISHRLDRRFEASDLPREPLPLQVVPAGTEQIIFVASPSLASMYAAQHTAQGKMAQVYTLEGSDVTHVRVASSHMGPLLPSLVQFADAVVMANLPLLCEQEQAAVDAIHALSHGGAILLDGDAAALPASVKKAAHGRHATVVSVGDFSVSLANRSLSDILAHPDSSSITAPDAWASEQPQTLSLEANALKNSKRNEAILPVETPYLKMLDQIFGSRLDIANACHASSVWSPDVSHPHAALPEFGYGRIANRLQERSRQVDHVLQVIRSSSLPLEVVRVLSQWLMLVNARQPNVAKIQDAADLVVRVLSCIASEHPAAQSILDKKELLYARSSWLVGSDTWAYDLGQSGLHHVMTSGDNINILIVDTAPYTSQPDREQQKKDIGLYAMNYGSVYVASVAVYASYTGVLQALMEADAYPGPSIVLAYLPQLHSVPDPLATLKETKTSVDTGAWPLYRWNPALEEAAGQDMFSLDSQRIKKSLEAFLARENHLTQLVSSQPDISSALVSSLESVS